MAGLKKVARGDRSVPASTFNELVDFVEQLKSQFLGNSVSDKNATKQTGWVKVLNDEATLFDQFQIVALQDAAFSVSGGAKQFKQNPAQFKVGTPGCSDVGKFAVLLEPLREKSGSIVPSAKAVASGIVQCRINVTNSAHEYADITPDEKAFLTSGEKGAAQILWRESGTGKKWAIVRISNSTEGTCVSTTTATMETTTPEGTTGEGTTGEGTTGEGTTGTGTTGEGTTGTGTTGTGTTGEGTTGTGTGEGTTGEGTTGEGTTGEGTTTAEGTTTTGECPPFECTADCQVSLEVVTDVQCVAGEIVVTKTTICLPSSQVNV